MGVGRDLPTESTVKINVERHAAKPFITAQDVSNLHEVIVDHIRQVVGWEPVGL